MRGPNAMVELLLRDEVYAIVGAAIEVHKEQGSGYAEDIYQESLEIELAERGIPFEPQKQLQVKYKQRVLRKRFVADFVCYDQMIVEIKAIDQLTAREESQVLNYLMATGFRVGLLINFGSEGKLEWKRYIK
jgi:GxxExxY protein